MESTATTRPKPTAAATPHPFNGDFRSIRVNGTLDEDDDGTFHLEISPGGETFSGTHTPSGGNPQTLTKVILNRRVIKVSAPDGRTWHGSIISLVNDPQKKIIIGRYHVPGGPGLATDDKRGTSDELAQDNGTWVATQP